MEVVYPHCAGLDVHKQTVTACVLISGGRGQPPHRTIRTFRTMTADLLALSTWLSEQAVTHVAMESTGVYWQPVWNLLESSFRLLLVNAQHVKAVPGRKTDVKDSEWLAELLRHGLLRSSFVPDRPQRELRELTRYRTTLIRERAAEVNRVQKTLEGGNLKLGAVASNVLGVSGRQMIEAIIAGSEDAPALAALARGKLREKLPELEQALTGRVGPHQRFLLAQQLAHLDYLDEAIARLDAEVTERLRPLAERIAQLDTIPGVGQRTAEVLLAEIGPDLSRFPSAAQLASWAGMCPGHHQSAGKRRSGRTRKGNPWLRTALIEAAHAASHTKATAFRARHQRLIGRCGKRKTTVALGHAILVSTYHLLTSAPTTTYADERVRSRDQHQQHRQTARLVHRLEALGYAVTLTNQIA